MELRLFRSPQGGKQVMKTDELWKRYFKTKNRNIKQQLIEEYIGLVKIVAGRMYNFYGSKVEYDDLVGFGIMGLIDSIERFDLSKNTKFETYAQIRIKGTIIDNIRKLDWIPRSLRKKSKEIQDGMSKLENNWEEHHKCRIISIFTNTFKRIRVDSFHISNFNMASARRFY